MTYTRKEMIRAYLMVPVWLTMLVVLSWFAAKTTGLPFSVAMVGVSLLAAVLLPVAVVLVRRRRD